MKISKIILQALKEHYLETPFWFKEKVQRAYDHALQSKGERNFNKVEELTGLVADWSDKDFGEPPAYVKNY